MSIEKIKGILRQYTILKELDDTSYEAGINATKNLEDAATQLSVLIEQVRKEERQKIEILEKALKDDATDLWQVTNAIKKEIADRDWIMEGRGCYQWDDDRYKDETRLAFEAVEKIIKDAQKPAANRYHQVISQLALLKEGEGK